MRRAACFTALATALALVSAPGCVNPRADTGPVPAAASRDSLPTGRQSLRFISQNGPSALDVNYLEFLPRGYGDDPDRRWPLILFLHGAGERGNDLERVKVHGPPKLVESDPDFPFVVISPQCREHETWSDEALERLLDAVIAMRAIDEDRVYLTGLSMGGFGAWSLAQAAPERFAAVVPICGGGSWERALLYGDSPKGRALRRIAFKAFHGARDPVVPLAESERMARALRSTGCQVELVVDPEAGHDSWTRAYADPTLYTWMLAHVRRRD